MVDFVRYTEIPEGEGIKNFIQLVREIQKLPEVDWKWLCKYGWTSGTALLARFPGEPDEDLVIGLAREAEALSPEEDVEFRMICQDFLNADLANHGVKYSISLFGLDWVEVIKMLLPVILQAILDYLNDDD